MCSHRKAGLVPGSLGPTTEAPSRPTARRGRGGRLGRTGASRGKGSWAALLAPRSSHGFSLATRLPPREHLQLHPLQAAVPGGRGRLVHRPPPGSRIGQKLPCLLQLG